MCDKCDQISHKCNCITMKRFCKDCKNSLFNEEVQLCKIGCERFQKDSLTDCTLHTRRD